eukprot:TRINITY_DN680_c0_g1_i2.p1 TRINITY_DN680_c0_g1~~TRINITY_DN680_c0_g1_i2.p1  ORF type:complete len:303 (-),score=59.90 TRINITY_DN680_c0_g1_i2:66-974(-)
MRDKLGRSRGFGFVYFNDEEIGHKIGNSHVVDGRKIEVKKAIPKNEIKTKKLFIGGIPLTLTDEELRAYFQQFGVVNECSIMKDRKTGQPRGFGFVSFEEYEIVENVLEMEHKIAGKLVEVKLAEPKKARDVSPPVVRPEPVFFPPVYPTHQLAPKPTYGQFSSTLQPESFSPFVDTKQFPMFDLNPNFEEFEFQPKTSAPAQSVPSFETFAPIRREDYKAPYHNDFDFLEKMESPFAEDMSRVVGGHRKGRKKTTNSLGSLFSNEPIFGALDERHSFSGFSDFANRFTGIIEEDTHRHSWG